MTTRREGPTGWRRAAFSHVEDVVRRLMVLPPPRSRTVRDLAFHRYGRQVRRILRAAPAEFEVVERRDLAVGAHSSVAELSLRGETQVAPGDVLSLWWRNSDARAAATASGEGSLRYWTTPLPHRPSTRRTATEEVLRREVVDLSGEETGWRRAPRIVPRFFTTSHAAGDGDVAEVRLQVTWDRRWPEQAAAYLHRAEPGERLRGWVLPHPHRVPTGPGLAIVTGSGAASVFAALRAGARDVRLLWGLGDKRLAGWVEAELEDWLASGALGHLEVVRAPSRVTDLLAPRTGELREIVTGGGWLFVSGNAAMGEQVDLLVGDALGDRRRRAVHESLRYIVST